MVGILPSLILYMFAKRPVQPVKLVRKACLKGQGAHSSMPSQPVPDFLAPSGFYPNYFRPHILGMVKGLGCFHLSLVALPIDALPGSFKWTCFLLVEMRGSTAWLLMFRGKGLIPFCPPHLLETLFWIHVSLYGETAKGKISMRSLNVSIWG